MAGFESIRLENGSDGIAVLSLDVPGAPLNPLSDAIVAELDAALDAVLARGDIRGIVVTSAKPAFAAGWNLKELAGQMESARDATDLYARTPGLSRFLRRLETCGKPSAAAITGLALGGGLELALACHYRVLADDPSAVVGLPEVKVGLLPGAGGTQRLPRLIGVEKALPLMLEGRSVSPREALALGIVHELAPAADLLSRARAWLAAGPEPLQPWDRKGFTVPGGASLLDPRTVGLFTGAVAGVTRATLGNYPAPAAILASAYEGLQLPMDRGLAIERQYFAGLASGPVALNLVRTMFINKGKADKLARRPSGVAAREVTRLGVLGAGMMGAGLAYAGARAGIAVAVLDTSPELAARSLDYASRVLAREQKSGRISEERSREVLGRIRPTTDFADLAGAEFVIEAVFEDRGIKAEVTARAEAVLDADAVFASNTSTLPISGLAEASARPGNFIGMHFFSPVERMPLVEIIRGRKTEDVALARALDLAKRLGKTPIVVNDSRGFFTSRVFATYCYEGQVLLSEGVTPALIENAGRFAGMPVGPLAVMDEVSLELQYKVVQQTRSDLGTAFEYPVSWNVLRRFVEDLKRTGRKAGAGFYEYPPEGRKFLWPGLAAEFPPASVQPSLEDVKRRLLYIQALEAARCLEEGVLTHPADGDLGSILGWGFPSWTGGVLSLIDTVGAARFVVECERLAERHGPRFRPPRSLVDLARAGRKLHATA
jgi:3-hydroxyacyl-CoA dehydrogenase / enoyl-CoA hydratase / 3-hydroxybutyryl-CoA epimerase